MIQKGGNVLILRNPQPYIEGFQESQHCSVVIMAQTPSKIAQRAVIFSFKWGEHHSMVAVPHF